MSQTQKCGGGVMRVLELAPARAWSEITTQKTGLQSSGTANGPLIREFAMGGNVHL